MPRPAADPPAVPTPGATQSLLPWRSPGPVSVTGDLPVDLTAGAFLHPLGLPWLSDSCLPMAASEGREFAVGDCVRLLKLPPPIAALPRAVRRRWDYKAGELFEVIAHTLPGQLAIARRIHVRGEDGVQVLYVPLELVERVYDFDEA